MTIFLAMTIAQWMLKIPLLFFLQFPSLLLSRPGVMSCQEVPNPSQEPQDKAVVPAEAGATQAVPTTSPKLPSVNVKAEVASSVESVASNGKASDGNIPAEICVVLGSSRNSQTQGTTPEVCLVTRYEWVPYMYASYTCTTDF